MSYFQIFAIIYTQLYTIIQEISHTYFYSHRINYGNKFLHSIAVTKFRKCCKFYFTVEICKFDSTLERIKQLLSYKKSSKYKYLFLYTTSLTESIGCLPIRHLLFFLITAILESVQVNCPQPQVKNPKLSFSISSIMMPLANDWFGSSTRLGSIKT